MKKSLSKIDIFCHVLPKKYLAAFFNKAQSNQVREDLQFSNKVHPALIDLDLRFSIMSKLEGMKEVLTILHPPVEIIKPADSVELAKIANDDMAELIVKYPEYFIAGVACLPMNDIDAAMREAERAIKELKFKGVQVYTPCNEKPLDSPEFLPLYEMMTKYDLPIWLHPSRASVVGDYKGEKESKYRVFQTISWPYETTVAMVRLVRGGVLEKYPDLKIITHHLGGMVPYFIVRLNWGGPPFNESRGVGGGLVSGAIEYYKKFYADTVVGDNLPALMCGYSFFGAEHVLFATDIPSMRDLEEKVAPVEKMPIKGSEKSLIFEGNARKLLHI